MPGKEKLKGKHKRGERGSVEEEQQTNKRANMADVEVQSSGKDKEAQLGASSEEARSGTSPEETSLLELKEMLVDIQITVSNILRENSKLTNEMAEVQSISRKLNSQTSKQHLPLLRNNMRKWKPS